MGRRSKNTFNVGIGPTIDVTIDGGSRLCDWQSLASRARHSICLVTPKPIGKLTGLGNVRQIVVARFRLAYIGSREDGLFVVDVSDPSLPRLIGRHDTIEFATGLVQIG